VVDRGMVYDLDRGGDGLRVRVLSPLGLEQQIGSDGATWLDRELVAHGNVAVDAAGFGREVADALERRAERLAEMGHARRQPDGTFLVQRNLIATRWSARRSNGSGGTWPRRAASHSSRSRPASMSAERWSARPVSRAGVMA
jgi:hypothetical protein